MAGEVKSDVYIVVYKNGTPKATLDGEVARIEAAGGVKKFTYYESPNPVLYGFAAAIPETILESVKTHAAVKYVEADGEVHALGGPAGAAGAYVGHCYCGAAEFTLKNPEKAMWNAYCHCSLCRKRAGGAPFTWSIGIGKENFAIDEAKLTRSKPNEKGWTRLTCSTCLSGIAVDAGFGYIIKPAMLDVLCNPNNANPIPANLAPKAHVYYADRIVDVRDGLPKFVASSGNKGDGAKADEKEDVNNVLANEVAESYTGACFCGACKFTIKAPTMWSGFCHCTLCRRREGSALATWSVGVAKENFSVTGETLSVARGGKGRSVCAVCHSPVAIDVGFAMIVSSAALDVILPGGKVGKLPKSLAPHVHIHTATRCINFDNGLQAFAGQPGAPPPAEVKANDYIVVYKNGTSKATIDAEVAKIEAAGGKKKYGYYEGNPVILNGFAASIPEGVLAAIKGHASVSSVEADGEMQALGGAPAEEKANVYIVVYKAGTPKATLDAEVARIEAAGGVKKFGYYESPNPVLYGYAAAIPASILESVKSNAAIKYVEADGEVHALGGGAAKPKQDPAAYLVSIGMRDALVEATTALLNAKPANPNRFLADFFAKKAYADLSIEELTAAIFPKFTESSDEHELPAQPIKMGGWLNAASFDPTRVKMRELEGGLNGFGVVLENVLTRRECLKIIEETEKVGYGKIGKGSTGKAYRGNRRLMLDDVSETKMGEELWRRIGPFIPKEFDVPSEKTSWKFDSLNTRYRLAKYCTGEAFMVHVDKPTINDHDRMTLLTVNIYLNDLSPEQGGRTRFYHKINGKPVAAAGGEAGSVVFFKQSQMSNTPWHDGEEVASGVKYLMRTDCVYVPSK